MAREGLSVLVLEAAFSVGGGTRSAELTLPGFVHDVCSAIHPFYGSSPFFRREPLEKFGLEWIHPPAAMAHPLDDGTAIMLENSIETTSEGLGFDGAAYSKLMRPLAADWAKIAPQILGPFRFPHHPLAMARFGFNAVQSARGLATRFFRGDRARALVAGLAAHSMLDIRRSPTASIALVLAALAHTDGWLLVKSGSGQLARAMATALQSYGGKIETGHKVQSMSDIPSARATLFDLTPRQIVQIAGDTLPGRYRRQLSKYRYGPGVFKIDWALDGPIPFRAEGCGRAATEHVGGTIDEIIQSESEVISGQHPECPFVILAQQSLFDSTRAPEGKHTAWAYCHVPHGSIFDMTGRIEAQVERFAPGFTDRIIRRHVMNPADFQAYNANYIGGDINGGIMDWGQLFTRPTWSLTPYRIPVRGLYVCSSSTPPGGGVHGMCGFRAARTALHDMFNIDIEI
ncbi:MAG: FAD-dependent oxidoreductase [candidate division Zixibacteria bacterium RBG_16_53_22]|nr:MAG: FAD-dependent oxidoreductase [candidate division Zixibacteria bacterium RBG_16_53_22]